MSQQGIRGYYQLTSTIKNQLQSQFTNTVTIGDISSVNLNKQDIFPLAHIIVMGTLHQDMYQLEGNPNLTPFHDRFENQLAGWSATMDVLIYNDIDIC